MIKELIGFNGDDVVWNTIPKRPLDIAVLVGDYSKAKRMLGWEPKFALEERLELTIDFWGNKLSKRDYETVLVDNSAEKTTDVTIELNRL